MSSSIVASKLLVHCNLASSNSEAKRMIRQSAVKIDGKRIDNHNIEIIPVSGMVVQVGKRNAARLKVVS